nr:minichromosome maintenance component complex 7-like protein [Cryptomonas sp.]
MLNNRNYKKFLGFLLRNIYVRKKDEGKKFKYISQIKLIVNKEKDIFEFFLDDLFNFSPDVFIRMVISNAKKFFNILKEIIDDIIIEQFPTVTHEKENIIYYNNFSERNYAKNSDNLFIIDNSNHGNNLPIYQIIIVPLLFQKPVPFFLLGASFIGKFILIGGTVIGIKEVQYLLKKASYSCKLCGFNIIQHVSFYKFKPLLFCPVEKCRYMGISGNLHFDTNLSIFEKIQEIKIETTFEKNYNANEIRVLRIQLNGHLTETCRIGDAIKVGGILLPLHFIDNKFGMTVEDIFLEASFIEKNSIPYIFKNKNLNVENEIASIFNGSNIFDKILCYLDFYIFGNIDLKKGLLLSLVGTNSFDSKGCYKSNNSVNIFIFYENEFRSPNVLKIISQIAPISVYNNALFSTKEFLLIENNSNGKKKNINDKISIANNGITCIDNIENLEEEDLVNVFKLINGEPLDCNIANKFKKLDKKSTIIATSCHVKNSTKLDKNSWIRKIFLNFDLVFPFFSTSNHEFDFQIASRIIEQYKISSRSIHDTESIRSMVIKALIFEAQKGFPFISDEAVTYVIYWYNNIKAQEKEFNKNNMVISKIDSILRISRCLARIKFQNKVCFYDIKEAFRLLETKNIYFKKRTNITRKDSKVIENQVYKVIKNMFMDLDSKSLDIKLIEKNILTKGYNCENLIRCIGFYEELNEFKVDINLGKISISV